MPRRPLRVLVVLALVVGAFALLHHVAPAKVVSGTPAYAYKNPAFLPQPSRTAEWAGTRDNALSQDAVIKLTSTAGYELLPKYAANYKIQSHFAEAKEVANANAIAHSRLRVIEYMSASYWYTANNAGWKPYSDSFQTSWYLKDSSGQPIPYYGIGRSADSGDPAIGYVLDLSNPQYRAWAVRTIVAWMKAAPYGGIIFDAANELVGDASRTPVGDSTSATYNEILCGAESAQDCPRVTAWNQGLDDLLQETRTALHPLGDEVFYNGVAPSPQRVGGRNLHPLHYADGATNESFCFGAALGSHDRLAFSSLSDDIAIMKTAAQQHKKVIEITNYQTSGKANYGDFCFASFLMGWQPGSSYFVWHSNYSDPLKGAYPENPEINLALGNPRGTVDVQGPVYRRTFDHGLAIVNTGKADATIQLSAAVVQFAKGIPSHKWRAGDEITVPSHGAFVAMYTSYLYG